MRPVIDALVSEHLTFEKEQIHLITTLYGILAPRRAVKQHLQLAKCLELMKASTLITDDFLDKSPVRNGIPSLFSRFGEEQTVLVAEVLKSSASIALMQTLEKMQVDKKTLINCLLVFEDTYRTVCLGQLEDIRVSKDDDRWSFTEKDYYKMIQKTTASFIQLPLIIGSIINGFDKQTYNLLNNYGLNIGMAYQIKDDVVDLISDTITMGKQVGGDIKEKKVRLPVIHALQFGSTEQVNTIKAVYNKKNVTKNDVNNVTSILNEIGSIQYCKQKVKYYCLKAINNVKYLAIDNLKQPLKDIAALLIPE